MRHVYLTKEEIDAAYRLGGITLQEVNELLHQVERCRQFYAHKPKAH
jgi:hypothetical protein